MARDRNEWNDIELKSAVSDLTGRRLGRVTAVFGKGVFRVAWDDNEADVCHRSELLARYTTSSAGFFTKAVTRS